MKTLYLECAMGAAGDMLAAALLELHPDPKGFLRRINSLGIPGVTITAGRSVKCGITGTRVDVTIDGRTEDSGYSHTHTQDGGNTHTQDGGHTHGSAGHHDGASAAGMADIERLAARLALSKRVKNDLLSVYRLIADAESHVHGKPVDQIHFHEVGDMDAVADITAVCMLMEELSAERVLASPIHVGVGTARCAHGILPVPAPATAHLLRAIPIYGGEISGELCTPTGAALLRYFVSEFCAMPIMKIDKIGYGMGKKNFAAANCLRAFLGETPASRDEVIELSCNLDDMTPEDVGFVQELLFEKGALDVYTLPAGMKKGRPGVLLTCMCRKELAQPLIDLILRHTTTLGVREQTFRRHVLDRELTTAQTRFGPVRIKRSFCQDAERVKAEYEDLAKIAREHDLTLADARKMIFG